MTRLLVPVPLFVSLFVPFFVALASCGGKSRASSSASTANAGAAQGTGACPAVPPPPDAASAPWIWASTISEADEAAPCEGQPMKSALPNEEARAHWLHALQADDAGRIEECIAEDLEGVRLEPSARAFLHLASCETRGGKSVEALRHADHAYAGARRECDKAAIKVAAKRVQTLMQDAPRIAMTLGSGLAPPELRTMAIDGATVPNWLHQGETLLMNPGPHEIAYCVDRDGTASQRSVKVQLTPHAEANVTLPP